MLVSPENIDAYLKKLDFEEIKSLCRPLETYLSLTSFVYRKSYNDGTEINISNQPGWVEHFYHHTHLLQYSVFDKHPDFYNSGFVLWSQLTGHQKILEHAKSFNITHGITIIKKVSDGVEFYYFGAKSETPEVVNRYLNNIDLLERFILYFKEQASEIIKNAKTNKIMIPERFNKTKILEKDLLVIQQSAFRENFIQATKLTSYHLEGIHAGIVLSARELQVAQCLLKGMTSKETGFAIFLSPRTVEDYLQQLREKFHVKTKSALRKKLIESNFVAYFPQE